MTASHYTGPVVSENGFQDASVGGSSMAAATIDALTVSSVDATDVKVLNVPTADPHVVGQLWSNAGVLTVSAG